MAETTITSEQVRRIYALGSAAGVLQSGNKNDNLHALVSALTGKDSIKALTSDDFYKVEHELLARMQMKNRTAPLKPKKQDKDTAPGMMNAKQQGLAWRMVYRLAELDENKSKATAGERMTGAIKKILGVDAKVEDPFKWVNDEQGTKLIETLKRYVRSAERRDKQRGSGC